MTPETTAPEKPTGRAGRDLRAAIVVGLSLAAVIIASLFTLRVIFVLVICLTVGTGMYELVRALRVLGRDVPWPPLVAGAVAMPLAAYLQGGDGLVLAFALTVLVVLAWRFAGQVGDLRPDLAACLFAAVYVGLQPGFAALLTMPPDGPRRTFTFIATAAFSDVGGYASGVLSGGKHKLAPTISPGKSWEGLAGSVVICSGVAIACLTLLLHGAAWQGALFGVAMAASATVGDLGESMIKRDIGIKDMGTLLPGHGGVMDRLDSLVCCAPVAWLLLSVFVPR